MQSLIPESGKAGCAVGGTLESTSIYGTDLSSAAEFWFFFRQNLGAVIGLALLGVFVALASLSPWLAPHPPNEIFAEALRLPPAWHPAGQRAFPLGTDDVGRDLLSRLMFGARASLGIGALVAVLSSALGSLLGLVAGYRGGWVDQAIMRAVDVLMALPSMLLAIVVVSILGPGLTNAILAAAIVAVPNFVRLVRASTMAEKNKQYVLASRSFGASHSRTLFGEILPNCVAPLIIQTSHAFSDGILNVAALGFLGLGAQPPTAEWGTMLADARPFIESSPWLVTYPGFCILLVVLGFNLFGDGLRDAFDPRLKR